jgi:hypothetical protein
MDQRPFTCPPTLDEVTDATLKLLPRGRAWQTHEGLPPRTLESAFNPQAFNPEAFSATDDAGAGIWQWFRVLAVMLDFLYVRICALRLEFWCRSIVETRDDWMKEYGLPDECDPFPDLCIKVAAIGGTRCEYYAEVAARAGWSINCEELISSCGSKIGCGSSLMGRMRFGTTLGRATLRIVVYVDESLAFQPTQRFLPPLTGRMRMGRRFSCGPNLLPLQCLLSRVIHAEIFTIYEVRTNGNA